VKTPKSITLWVYTQDAAREKVFNTLEATLSPSVSTQTGRPGMEL